MYNQYLVLGNAHAGREQEHDDWYVWVHEWDVMGPREVAVAAQAFRRSEIEIPSAGPDTYSHGFLCAYENTDPEAMTGPGGGAIPEDMLISSAANHAGGMGGGYFDTVAFRTRTPGRHPDADLIAEWLWRPNVSDEDIAAYVDTRFTALMTNPDVVSGWVGKVSDHQPFDLPRPRYVAFYRTTRLEALAACWTEGEVPFPLGWNSDDLSVSAFRQISKRTTRAEVLQPDPASARKAEEVRKAAKPMVF